MIVYGFFYNSCVFESADALVSLHLTKKGAYEAMRDHRLSSYSDARRVGEFRGHNKKLCLDKEPDWKTWKVLPVEVLP